MQSHDRVKPTISLQESALSQGETLAKDAPSDLGYSRLVVEMESNLRYPVQSLLFPRERLEEETRRVTWVR